MLPRLVLAVLMTSLAVSGVASVYAQSVGGRNSSWTPYRPLEVEMPTEELPSVATTKPTQYVECEPCPPVYEEFISDAELSQMRGPRGMYYVQSTAPQPMYVPQGAVSPFMTTQTAGANWDWELLPGDVIWHSYMAGSKESRMSGVIFEELNGNVTMLDVTLGGRASIVRYGTRVNGRPEGWELQIEGAGMPRINLDENWDLEAADFRFGMPLVYGVDRWQFKFSYYHLSSHVGDEYLQRNPTFQRINYARDALVIATSFFPLPAWRWYAEAEWAFYADEGADPWAFQFGVEYAQPGPTGIDGTPFFAVNGHIREEVDYGGMMVAQAGWLWRGNTGKVIRTGVHYHNGKSNQFEFSNEFEQQIGAGLWYDY